MAKSNALPSIQFIKISISKHALIGYEHAVHSANDWPFYVEELIHTGYKVSIVGKENGSSVGMTVTDQREKSVNKNCCFSQWSASIGEASQKCAVITSVYEGRPWSEIAAEINQEDKAIFEEFLKYMDSKRK